MMEEGNYCGPRNTLVRASDYLTAFGWFLAGAHCNGKFLLNNGITHVRTKTRTTSKIVYINKGRKSHKES